MERSIMSASPAICYAILLRQERLSYIKIRKFVYAIKDHDEHGKLLNNYVIVERIIVDTELQHVCSCNQENCLHIVQVKTIWPTFIREEDDEENYNIINLSDGLYGVYCGSYSIIKKTNKTSRCLVCESRPEKCIHSKYFAKNSAAANIPPVDRDPVEFKCISDKPIPYPLDADPETFEYDLADIKKYALGIYPQHLVPVYDPTNRCEHGNLYSQADPVSTGCIKQSNAIIHLSHMDLECMIYYRPSQGHCQCRQRYDGRAHMLLNFDDKNLYSYTWLLELLHNNTETRYPLASAFRSANRTRIALGGIPMKEYMRSKLREAYNCFIRLLKIDYQAEYQCLECGPHVETVVCDGIMSGCRQDQMPPLEVPDLPPNEIQDTSLGNRIFIEDAATRQALGKYAYMHKGRYGKIPEKIPDQQFQNLCQALTSNPSLRNAVLSAGNPCPPSLQQLFGELSKCTPTCGILQITGKHFQRVREILQQFINGDFSNLSIEKPGLKKYCPLIVDFLSSEDIPKRIISHLLSSILSSMELPFLGNEKPRDEFYGPPSETYDDLGFFPNHPIRKRSGRYAADRKKDALLPECRKNSSRHPSMTPGLVTFYCPHGINLGFQIMQTPESPKTIFDVLMMRFKRMPKLIIYDNACHLHTYCLKREPNRFENTRFMVDRLHFRKGHTGCSLGYDMTRYNADEYIVGINSQVNEQANRAIHNLSTQMACMGPQNVIQHMKTFLALRNMQRNAVHHSTKQN